MKKFTRSLLAMVLFSSSLLFASGTDTGTSTIIAESKTNTPAMDNTKGATEIIDFYASDENDKTADITYIIKTLPSTDLGVLYLPDGTKVKVDTEYSQAQVNGFKFDPAGCAATDDAKFTYVGVSNNVEGTDIGTITIPLTEGDGCSVSITTDDKNNDNIVNTLSAVNILDLSGKDVNGDAITKFTIKSLPSADAGVLYLADGTTPVEVGQTLTKAQADGLKFDPKAGYVGTTKFTYQSVGANGGLGNVATVTLPIVSNDGGNTITTDDKNNDNIVNTLSAVNILDLSGKDVNGDAITKFTIKSLPSADAGVLYLADGTTPVEVGQTLTKAQADGLKFDPKAGYVGTTKFTYQSVGANGGLGNVATVTLPIVSNDGGGGDTIITDDKVNPEMSNALPAVDILNLSGKDENGNPINKFVIKSLPNADAGILYMADGTTPVEVGQTLTKEEADGLKFDPKDGYVGTASFTYQSVSDYGDFGNVATVTLPIVNGNNVKTDDKVNPEMSNALPAVDILNLSGKDANGVAVNSFIIKSLPSADAGILYMADGTTPVQVGQTLTKEEADGLKFDPKDGYVGTASFTYQSVADNGDLGNVATVTLPIVAANSVITDDKVNPEMSNALPAVDILNLSGKDANGVAVNSFIIKSLPSADAGILYMADGTTPVRVDQNLTREEADGLKFDPKSGYVGTASFTYQSVADNGDLGNVATVTIPVVDPCATGGGNPDDNCTCDDYSSSVPTLSNFGLMLMIMLTSLMGALLARKELK